MTPRAAQCETLVDAANRRGNFKGFNDLYGHSAGDDSLIDVAAALPATRGAPRRRIPDAPPTPDTTGAMRIAKPHRKKSSRRSVSEYG
jgi:hypothetical protein